MSKSLSLLFSITATLILIGVAVSLSYRSLGWALALFVLWFIVVGLGFVVKARLRKIDSERK